MALVYCVALSHQQMLKRTVGMVRNEAFGTLRSRQQLAERFLGLSDGSRGSLQDVLTQHIAVAADMREVFLKAGAAYLANEDDNQRAVNGAGGDA